MQIYLPTWDEVQNGASSMKQWFTGHWISSNKQKQSLRDRDLWLPQHIDWRGFPGFVYGGQSWRSRGLSGLQSQSWKSRVKREGKLWGQRVGDERGVQRIDSETRAGDRIKAICSTNICANTVQKKMLPLPLLLRHAKKC